MLKLIEEVELRLIRGKTEEDIRNDVRCSKDKLEGYRTAIKKMLKDMEKGMDKRGQEFVKVWGGTQIHIMLM